MKKLFKLSCLLTCGLLAVSCSSEEPVVNSPESENEAYVTFNLNIDALQANEPATRSLASGYHFADGRSISTVKCYVYNQASGASAAPIKTLDISISNLKGEIKIPLPKNDVFDIVFLATAFDQSNTSSKMFYNSTERSLNINYTLVKNNDEEMDCFFAVQKDISTASAVTKSVELKRPFAQLNIGAKDYDGYNASYPVQSTSVSVSGIYNKMLLMDGSVVGSPMEATFEAAPLPDNQVYPIEDAQYIAMNYLLVNQRKLINASITIKHHQVSTEDLTIPIDSIAVERNYQTNVTIKSLNN